MENSIKSTLDLLKELYIGVHDDQTWVIDRNPGHGFTAAIATISAEQASTPIVEGGSTIAAHTEHLRWSLTYAMEFYKGKTPSADWAESWTIHEVNEEEWGELQQGLLDAYLLVRETISKIEDWSNEFLFTGTLALVPHAAYHLGSVKQMMLLIKSK